MAPGKCWSEARREVPGGRWEQADLAEWHPDRPVDLIYANASLHWLDDHAALFPRLMSFLKPGGCLAVQMPRNHDRPSHQAAFEWWSKAPGGTGSSPSSAGSPSPDPEAYLGWLAPLCRPPRHLGDGLPPPAGGTRIRSWPGREAASWCPCWRRWRKGSVNPSWRPTGTGCEAPTRRMRRAGRPSGSAGCSSWPWLRPDSGLASAFLALASSSPRRPPPGAFPGCGSFRWTRPQVPELAALRAEGLEGVPLPGGGGAAGGAGAKRHDASISFRRACSITKKI